MNRYKALFFDADDTLFDYPAAERSALTSILRRFRIPLPIEDVIPAYRRHNLVLWREFEQGLTTQDSLREERFRRLFAEFGIIRAPIPAISDSYLEALSGNSQLLDGAMGLVSGLAACHIRRS
jgi:FMN phosphatase YigB (HAD superfamily)